MQHGKTRNLLYREKSAAWLLSAPTLILLFLFVILPFLYSIGYSFTNRNLVVNAKVGTQFVGFKNYIELFQDKKFYQAIGNNVYFTLVAVPIQVVLALLLAMLINVKAKGVSLFRTIYYSPVIMPMLVVSITWSLLFAPEPTGFINTLLHNLSFGHIEPLKWFYSKDTSMLSIIILSVWQGVGFQMMIFLAGLQDVPGELYEAAHIDGAGPWQQFRAVTLPGIRNTMIFVLLSTTIFSLKMFTQVMILTQGGPLGSTNTVVYMLYTSGYIDQRIGYASSISVVFFLAVLVISLIQQKSTKMVSN